MVSAEKLGYLLDGTRRIIAHQKEVAELRGETFNVFSILRMERLENSTHSAFITELLSPDGTHLKGNIFLKLFLETLDEVHNSLNLDNAKVKPEHHVGARDIDSKSGGRIDIYIWDGLNSISIENKIDAGDQEAQIERYCNHNKGRNTVLYLTLHGTEPSNWSKGTLECGIDFYTISYRKHIIEWLDKCIKEAADSPILRETIKQYKILIQKLTAAMAEKQTEQLTNLMLKHYKEAEYIYTNFNKVKIDIKEGVRKSVIKRLEEQLSEKYIIVLGNNAESRHSNIWIKPKGMEDSPMFFGVEGFSGLGHFGGALFVGVFNEGGEKTRASLFQNKFSDWWVKTSLLTGTDQLDIKLNEAETLQLLSSDNKYRDNITNQIVNEVEEYLQKETEPLRNFLQLSI